MNSLIKNIFEEEKKFDSTTLFFCWKIVPYWVHFGQGQDFKLTTKLSEKVQYSGNQEIKNSLNEEIRLMSINGALISRSNFVSFVPPRLTVYEGNSNF